MPRVGEWGWRPPVGGTRTYGLFRGRDLIALMVANVHIRTINYDVLHASGCRLLMLETWDVTKDPGAADRLRAKFERTQ